MLTSEQSGEGRPSPQWATPVPKGRGGVLNYDDTNNPSLTVFFVRVFVPSSRKETKTETCVDTIWHVIALSIPPFYSLHWPGYEDMNRYI